MSKPEFQFGTNIAIKIPKDRYDDTLRFYRDTLGMKLIKEEDDSLAESWYCDSGNLRIWFDRVDTYSQTDIWLELKSDDMNHARELLRGSGVSFRDELEKLPEKLDGHWISDPAGVVMLLCFDSNS